MTAKDKKPADRTHDDESRYRRLFDTSELSIWDEDFSEIKPALDHLHQTGVTDLRAYLDAHPEETLHMASLVRINAVNEATLKLYGIDSEENFIKNLAGIMTEETLGTFVDVLCAIWNHETHFSTEVSHRTFDGRDITVVFSLPIPRSPSEWHHVPVSVLDISERKTAEQALRESEERYRDLVSSTQFGVVVHQDDIVIFVNPAIAEIFGYSVKETIGANRNKFLAPQHRQKISDFVKGRSEGFIEFKGQRKDGSEIWIESAASEINWNGQPARLNTMLDITARKKMAHQLQQSEERYRNLTEGSIQGVVIHQGGFVPLFVNSAYARIFGYDDPKEILQLSSIEPLFAPGEIERVNQYSRARQKNGGAPNHYEYEGKRKDGKIIRLENFVRLVDWEGKKAIQSTVVDITSRYNAETELRVSQARLSGILDIAPEAIITTDSLGNILMFNQGAKEIFGYEESEMIGQSIEKTIPQRFRLHHAEKMALFSRSEDDTRHMSRRGEIAGLRKDGTEFPAEASVSKLLIGGEQIFNVILHDITQRKLAEREILDAKGIAESASRTKSEFLANMSHELRTPLNAVLGFSEIMIKESLGPLHNSKYLEYASDIHNAGAHLLNLINDILDVSKIEAGALDLAEGAVDMNRVIGASARMIKERANRKSVELKVKNAADLPLMRADERAVKQIALNLLSNAVKFTDEAGTVSISCSTSAASGIVLTISDSGIGIAPDDIEKALLPFGQVGDTQPNGNEGTGLGLPLAKKSLPSCMMPLSS